MSMRLEFEPHSWYKGFAIQDNRELTLETEHGLSPYQWIAYTDNGNTYQIDTLKSQTLKDLRILINDYRSKQS